MTPIIEKIKKLLNLAQSENAHEAATAAGLAQKLMTEYQIAEAELTDENDEKAQAEADPLFTYGEQKVAWLNVLSAGVCKLNNVFSYNTRGVSGAWVSKIIGRPRDIETVRYLFAWLHSEIERLAQKHARGGGRAYMASYRMGAASGALEAMRKTTQEARAQATGAALVKVDARITDARALAPNGLRAGGRSRVSNSDAFARGKAHGSNLHGSTQIGAGGTRMLGSKK